jgi:hypothetical protein
MIKLDEDRAARLNRDASIKLEEGLKRYGNSIGWPQRLSLITIIQTYTDISIGAMSGRYAFALPTGMGKTCSIIAWLSTLNKLGHDHISVAVCGSKVEHLCDIVRKLILEENVPSDKIGLVHSYRYDEKMAQEYRAGKRELLSGYASYPSINAQDSKDKQILLLTHQRVKGKGGIEQFNLYRGEPRDLFVWDESLIVSESFAFRDDVIESVIGQLAPLRQGKTPMRDQALDYLRSSLEIVKEEIRRQHTHPESPPKTIKLLPLGGGQVEEFKMSLGEDDSVAQLKAFLDVSQEELRVLLDIEQGGGVITYNTVIPRELQKIVILDASHTIRDLVKMDSSILNGRIEKDLLSYENVVVHQLWYPSGRNTMRKEFAKRKRKDGRVVIKEIIEVVKAIPPDEGILIFTFKAKGGVDYKKILRSDLREAGIDIDACVDTRDGPKSRFVFLTWGSETSVSHFSYCSNVILAGVLHRSHIDIGAAIAGQKEDLCTSISNDEIRQVIQSEIAHSLYQAMSRGSSRVIRGFKTLPMRVWVIHRGNIRSLIEKVMSKVVWKEWRPKYLHIEDHILERLRDLITVYLQGQSKGVAKVSTKQIKRDLKLTEVPSMTFTKVIRGVSRSLSDWQLIGRSMVRDQNPFLCGT